MLKLLIMTLLLSSCAFFTERKGPIREYMTSVSHSDSLEQIEKNLIKKSTNAGKRYVLTVLPLSALVLNKRKQEKTILPQNKVCFEINLNIETQKNEVSKDFWKGKIINTQKEESDLQWLSSTDNINYSLIKGPYGRHKRWQQKDIMCTQKNFDFKKNFKIILTSKSVPFPYTNKMVFQWDFIHYEIKDGKKVKAKKIYKKKRYRNW